MKKIILLIFALLLLNNWCYSQNKEYSPFTIEYVEDISIKMDGYCVYYTYDSLEIDSLNVARKAILAINKLRQIAIIKIAGKSENNYLRGGTKDVLSIDRDTSIYKGYGYTVKLNTHITEEKAYRIKYKGLLTITYRQKDTTIKVKGVLVK